MLYEILPITLRYEAEIRNAFPNAAAVGADPFSKKDRMLARAQAIASVEAHGRLIGLAGTSALLAKVREAERVHGEATDRNDATQCHVEEVVMALYGYALTAHRNRWLTWWSVVAACVGVSVSVVGIVAATGAGCSR